MLPFAHYYRNDIRATEMTRGTTAAWLIAAAAFVTLGVCAAAWFVQLGAAKEREEAAQSSLREFKRAAEGLQDVSAQKDVELAKVKEKSDVIGQRLRAALARTPDCSLGADAGRVLRDVVQAPGATAGPGDQARPDAADPAVAGGGGDQVEIDGQPVSCKAVAEWAQRNIAICQQDAVRFRGAIRSYEVIEGVR